MKKAMQKIKLYCLSGSDHSIVDETGQKYTPEEAQAAWNAGRVEDYNLAFFRLTQLNFSIDALLNSYEKQQNTPPAG